MKQDTGDSLQSPELARLISTEVARLVTAEVQELKIGIEKLTAQNEILQGLVRQLSLQQSKGGGSRARLPASTVRINRQSWDLVERDGELPDFWL